MKFLKRIYRKRREKLLLDRGCPEEIFTDIYRTNKWHDAESRSGRGSGMERTSMIRRELPALLQRLHVNSMLDIPCGDYYWMKEIHLPLAQYLGADIVPDVIAANQRQYADEHHRFCKLDLLQDPLPTADLILCRECLVHFSLEDAARAIRNILDSGGTWLLTTQFPDVPVNIDIPTGKHRPLNLLRPPFNWPIPHTDLLEYDTGRKYGVKHLTLWRIDQLPRPG